MRRSRILLVCAIVLGACRRAPAPVPDFFPEVVGAWHRTSAGELPPALEPDSVPRAAVERIRAASYEGPGKLDARLYQLTSPAVALDVVQRWKPAPGTVFFYSGRFFILIRWQTADRKALREFVRALEQKFPASQ
jgi:hypothetical protein